MARMLEGIGGGLLRVDVVAAVLLAGIIVSDAAGRIWVRRRPFFRVFRQVLVGMEWVTGICCCLAGILGPDTRCLFRGTSLLMGIFSLAVLDGVMEGDDGAVRPARSVEVYVAGVSEPVEVIDGVTGMSVSDGITELVIRSDCGRAERRYMTQNFFIKDREAMDGI